MVSSTRGEHQREERLAGGVPELSYFIWAKTDSVGVLSNLFPVTVALYNLVMHYRYESRFDADDAPRHA